MVVLGPAGEPADLSPQQHAGETYDALPSRAEWHREIDRVRILLVSASALAGWGRQTAEDDGGGNALTAHAAHMAYMRRLQVGVVYQQRLNRHHTDVWIARAVKEAVAVVRSGSVTTVVKSKSERVLIPMHEQGDADFATADQFRARKHLRQEPSVVEALEALWQMVLRDVTVERGYTALYQRVHRLLIEEWDAADSASTIAADYERDLQGAAELSRESFYDSLWELADVWTPVVSASVYAQFLWELLRLTTDGQGGWRPLEGVSFDANLACDSVMHIAARMRSGGVSLSESEDTAVVQMGDQQHGATDETDVTAADPAWRRLVQQLAVAQERRRAILTIQATARMWHARRERDDRLEAITTIQAFRHGQADRKRHPGLSSHQATRTRRGSTSAQHEKLGFCSSSVRFASSTAGEHQDYESEAPRASFTALPPPQPPPPSNAASLTDRYVRYTAARQKEAEELLAARSGIWSRPESPPPPTHAPLAQQQAKAAGGASAAGDMIRIPSALGSRMVAERAERAESEWAQGTEAMDTLACATAGPMGSRQHAGCLNEPHHEGTRSCRSVAGDPGGALHPAAQQPSPPSTGLPGGPPASVPAALPPASRSSTPEVVHVHIRSPYIHNGLPRDPPPESPRAAALPPPPPRIGTGNETGNIRPLVGTEAARACGYADPGVPLRPASALMPHSSDDRFGEPPRPSVGSAWGSSHTAHHAFLSALVSPRVYARRERRSPRQPVTVSRRLFEMGLAAAKPLPTDGPVASGAHELLRPRTTPYVPTLPLPRFVTDVAERHAGRGYGVLVEPPPPGSARWFEVRQFEGVTDERAADDAGHSPALAPPLHAAPWHAEQRASHGGLAPLCCSTARVSTASRGLRGHTASSGWRSPRPGSSPDGLGRPPPFPNKGLPSSRARSPIQPTTRADHRGLESAGGVGLAPLAPVPPARVQSYSPSQSPRHYSKATHPRNCRLADLAPSCHQWHADETFDAHGSEPLSARMSRLAAQHLSPISRWEAACKEASAGEPLVPSTVWSWALPQRDPHTEQRAAAAGAAALSVADASGRHSGVRRRSSRVLTPRPAQIQPLPG